MDPSATAQHTDLLVLSIWETVTNNCKLRKANAFSIFLSHLSQCRQSALHDGDSAHATGTPPLGSSLLHSDRWLVAQLGIALLRLCERNKEWQSGYVILHHLHRFGIHYVRLSQPPSPLPPLLPTAPSPCSVALTAVNLCLHLERETHSALEVMRGCEWVEASDGVERDSRTEMLATLTQRCLDSKMLEDAWQCLNAIEQGEVAAKFVHPVTNLHNKLLQSVLNTQNHQYSVFVFKSMCKAGLQCLPSVFSGLLQLLCDSEQVWVWFLSRRRTFLSFSCSQSSVFSTSSCTVKPCPPLGSVKVTGGALILGKECGCITELCGERNLSQT